MAKRSAAGLKEAARQFETMFLQMVMRKHARCNAPGRFDGQRPDALLHSMLDQQLAQNPPPERARLRPSDRGTVGQYSEFRRDSHPRLGNLPGMTCRRRSGVATPKSGCRPDAVPRWDLPPRRWEFPRPPRPMALPPTTAREFVNRCGPTPSKPVGPRAYPQFLVAHSALESGWGRSEPRRADGGNSFNLFGIKAGKNWNGPTLDAVTTEYVDGQAQRVTEKFRAYGSYAEAFQDYAALLRNSPRFGAVIGSQDGTEFARRPQQAGYATDPAYAENWPGSSPAPPCDRPRSAKQLAAAAVNQFIRGKL